jgi:hypothetical protein
MPRCEFKHRYWFFADTPNVAWALALFEKIYNGEPIFTVFSNIGEDVHCTIPLFQLSV